VLAASIIRAMIEAVNTSETSVNFYQTIRRNISEDSHLYHYKGFHGFPMSFQANAVVRFDIK
jgi:hypothetical protein